MSDELRPCSFCGAPPLQATDMSTGRPRAAIMCDNALCAIAPEVVGHSDTPEERARIAAVWNTRPTEGTLRAACDAMLRECERLRAEMTQEADNAQS